jgi:hypothetical protein
VSVKARWHSPTVRVEADDADPFADDTPIEQAVHVPTVGLPIDLNMPQARLNERLRDNLSEQSRLYSAGIDCDIRWMSDSHCSACPVSQHEQPGERGQLCRLAREQEGLGMLLNIRAAAVDGGRR